MNRIETQTKSSGSGVSRSDKKRTLTDASLVIAPLDAKKKLRSVTTPQPSAAAESKEETITEASDTVPSFDHVRTWLTEASDKELKTLTSWLLQRQKKKPRTTVPMKDSKRRHQKSTREDQIVRQKLSWRDFDEAEAGLRDDRAKLSER